MNKRQKELEQIALDNEKEVLKALKANYADALNEIDDRIAMLLGRADADMQHVIYQVEYQKALKGHVQGILDTLNANNFETVSEYLTKSYEDGFIGAMYDMQGQGIPLVLPINQEQVVNAIQHETKLSEGLYAALGKDTKVLSKKIASEISRGISNAATYSQIAKNIEGYAGISRNNAMRIARTESHRIQNKSINDAQEKAKDKGADIVKIWSAALDGNTRPTHRELDGQIREMDEPFEVDGMTAMYPGDFGDPAEDINCRCRCNSKARWLLDEPITKWSPSAPVEISDDGTTQLFKIEAKDYESFKKQYFQATEKIQDTLENIGKSGKINLDLQFFAEKDIVNQSSSSLKKAIRKYEANIKEHEDKILKPEKYIADWDDKDPREQKGLIKHWTKEIRNFNQSIDDRIDELKNRGDYDG